MTRRSKPFPGTPAALLVALILTLTGCTGKDNDVQPTDTQATALQRVEKLVQEASAQLPQGAKLQYNDGSDTNSCDDPTDNGPAGRIFVEHRYKIIAPDNGAWTRDQVITPLATFWQQQGYRVNNDKRSAPDPTYNVETTDGYYATVDGYDRGGYYDFTLTAGSPCIWQNGTPAPQ